MFHDKECCCVGWHVFCNWNCDTERGGSTPRPVLMLTDEQIAPPGVRAPTMFCRFSAVNTSHEVLGIFLFSGGLPQRSEAQQAVTFDPDPPHCWFPWELKMKPDCFVRDCPLIFFRMFTSRLVIDWKTGLWSEGGSGVIGHISCHNSSDKTRSRSSPNWTVEQILTNSERRKQVKRWQLKTAVPSSYFSLCKRQHVLLHRSFSASCKPTFKDHECCYSPAKGTRGLLVRT